MKTESSIKNPPYNKCKHCRVAALCLPADIKQAILKDVKHFNFRARILEPGQHLFYQGQHSECLYALRSGILKSYLSRPDGEEFVMGFHMPPDMFGWEAIDPQQGSLSIIALEHCNICEIPLSRLEKLMSHHPELLQQLMLLVSQKVQMNNTVLLRTTAEQRVTTFILNLFERYKALGIAYNTCQLVMTHQDIANYLRIAPETISRTLRNLQSKGIVKVQRRNILIENLPRLHTLAQLGVETENEKV